MPACLAPVPIAAHSQSMTHCSANAQQYNHYTVLVPLLGALSALSSKFIPHRWALAGSRCARLTACHPDRPRAAAGVGGGRDWHCLVPPGAVPDARCSVLEPGGSRRADGLQGNAERQPRAPWLCQCFQCLSVSPMELKAAAPAFVFGADGKRLPASLFFLSTKQHSYPRNQNSGSLNQQRLWTNPETQSLQFPNGTQIPETTRPVQHPKNWSCWGQG